MNHNYNEMLVDFVQRKDEIVLNQCEIHYIDERDIQSILMWSAKNAELIFEEISLYITTSGNLIGQLGQRTCPWCFYQENTQQGWCTDCDYGYHHGLCKYNFLFNRNNGVTFNYKMILHDVISNSQINNIVK